MPNGLDLILDDHQKVDDLFAQFDKTGDATLIGVVIDMLKAHDEAEHGALYPLTQEVLGDFDLVERSEHAHTLVKKQIDVVTDVEGATLIEEFGVLREMVTEHVADEEKNLIPALEKNATPQQLDSLGARILQIKQRVG